MTTTSQGSHAAAKFFLSRSFLDRDLHRSTAQRVLPRTADFVLARIPLALCPDPWPVIQARARVDLHQLNEAAGRNREGTTK